ncbi:MAG: hypothetical protein R3B72_12220 [Polyangiaceae bacterium]
MTEIEGAAFGLDMAVGPNGEALVVWQDAAVDQGPAVRGVVVDPAGVASEPVVVAEALAYQPLTAWGHGSFLVTYRASTGSRLLRMSADGSLVGGAPTEVGRVSDLLATANGFALALHGSGPADVSLQWLDGEAQPLGAPLAISEPAGISEAGPAIAPQKDGLGFFWDDARNANHDIYHRRTDAAGTPTSAEEVVVDDAETSRFVVAADLGDATAIAWIDDNMGVRVAKLADDGAILAGPRVIDDITSPAALAMAVSDAGIGLLIVGSVGGAILDVRDEGLERLGATVLDADPKVAFAALASTGEGFVAAWRKPEGIRVARGCRPALPR